MRRSLRYRTLVARQWIEAAITQAVGLTVGPNNPGPITLPAAYATVKAVAIPIRTWGAPVCSSGKKQTAP